MTAFSFILGVIPLVIASGAGAASRVSLGTAVFGGMLIGIVGMVLFTPVFYLVIQTMAERLGGGPSKPLATSTDIAEPETPSEAP